MRFLLTQFGRGDNAFLRVVELALAVNREMERRDQERYHILVPWIHGERQRQILNEAFGDEDDRYPGEILLDERLGRILSLFLSNDMSYATSIAMWIAGWEDTGRVVRDHYNHDVTVSDLSDRSVNIGEPNIALELTCAPLFHIGVALSYQVTSCRQSQLFEAMGTLPTGTFALGYELIRNAKRVSEEIERNLCRTYVSVPGTFTPPEMLLADTLNSELVPPAVSLPPENSIEVSPNSIYVTVSGESAMNKSLQSALKWDVPVFTNDPERLRGGRLASAGVLMNPNIRFHFAHADGESLDCSLLTEKPLLVTPFDPLNSPEIYFNGMNAVDWKTACLYQNEPLQRQQAKLDELAPQLKKINENLRRRFGTLVGNAVAAQKIVDDLLK